MCKFPPALTGSNVFWVVSVVALLCFGANLGNYASYLHCIVMVNVIATIGLNIVVGNSGQISLCQSSFMAVGAYASTLIAAHFGTPFWVAIPAGTVLAAMTGAIVALPTRRLRGIYLALATLGFLQIVQIAIEEWASVTGGVRGLSVPKPIFAPGLPVSSFALYAVTLGCCILSIWTASNLLKTRIGREINAVRLSPYASQSLGIGVGRVRVTAFAISAAYAGLAGGLFSLSVGFVDPAEFGLSSSLRLLTYIVVGGMGSLPGSVLGALVLSGLPELLRDVKEYSDLVYAAILLAALLFMPHGLVRVARLVPYMRRKLFRKELPT